MKCTKCGSESEGKFCQYCGAPLQGGNPSRNQDNGKGNGTKPAERSQGGPQEGNHQGAGRQGANYQGASHQSGNYQGTGHQGASYQGAGYPRKDYQSDYYRETANIPPEYTPITMWGYFGYQLLFAIPCIGFILLLVYSFGGTQNQNLKNFARSYFCLVIIGVAIFAFFVFITTVVGCIGASSY